MRRRPTPKTDAAEFLISVGRKNDEWLVQSDFARKLERERDEAREALDCLLAVIGLTPIAGNKKALQETVDQCLVVLRKQEETK
jgi:hypothetical protein